MRAEHVREPISHSRLRLPALVAPHPPPYHPTARNKSPAPTSDLPGPLRGKILLPVKLRSLLVLALAAVLLSLRAGAATDQNPPAAPTAPTPAADAPAVETKAAPAAPAAKKAGEEVFVMPKFEVRRDRVRWLDREIKRIDKMIARERAKVKSTDLDRALNNDKLVRAAAIFGGNTADHLSAVAATRVNILENEREILEAMKRPATLEEMAMFEEQIAQLRLLRRDLDDAAKQR